VKSWLKKRRLNTTNVPSHRIEQINKLILEQLNIQILREINLPVGCLVTITKVNTTRDFSLSRVTASIIPAERNLSVLGLLNNKAGYLQHLIAQKIAVFKVPKLTFILDTGGVHVERLDELIDKIHHEK